MEIRDKVIVVKVPSGQASEPKNGSLTKKAVLEKLEAEFVRVSGHYYKEKSEYYEGYREGLSQALWLLKKWNSREGSSADGAILLLFPSEPSPFKCFSNSWVRDPFP